jgi:hypothetical protein
VAKSQVADAKRLVERTLQARVRLGARLRHHFVVSSHLMALASLLVAVLALVIAVASAVYTRRQATASEGVLAIERSRRLEERRPKLTGKVERVERVGRAETETRLVVTLESNEPLAAIELTIPVGQGITFRRLDFGGVRPVRPGSAVLAAFSYDIGGGPIGMRPRDSMSWSVDLAQEHVNTLRLEASCHGTNGEQWDSVMIAAPVEPDISRTVW